MSVTSQSFGDLAKIGIGYLEPAVPSDVTSSQFVLRKVTVKNKETNQTFKLVFHCIALQLQENLYS